MGISSYEANVVIMSGGGDLLASPAFSGRFFNLHFDPPLPVGQTFHHTDNKVSVGPMYVGVVALLCDSV